MLMHSLKQMLLDRGAMKKVPTLCTSDVEMGVYQMLQTVRFFGSLSCILIRLYKVNPVSTALYPMYRTDFVRTLV